MKKLTRLMKELYLLSSFDN